MAHLLTLTVFPVDYRKAGPATGLPEFLSFLPDFSQPDKSVQKIGFLLEHALKLLRRWWLFPS